MVTDQPTPPQAPSKARSGLRTIWIGPVLLLAVLVVAAALAMLYTPARLGRACRRPGRLGPIACRPSQSSAPADAEGPASLVAEPLYSAGLTAVNADPDGISPPAGAQRRLAWKREIADELSIEASYAYSGSFDKAAEHYRRQLGQRGFSLLSDEISPSGLRVMVFTAGPTRALVALRNAPGEAKMNKITVTVLKPAPKR